MTHGRPIAARSGLMLRRALALCVLGCADLRRTPRANPDTAIPALQRGLSRGLRRGFASTQHTKDSLMHTEAFNTSLALIDHLAVVRERQHVERVVFAYCDDGDKNGTVF